jgi:hypothetical protein
VFNGESKGWTLAIQALGATAGVALLATFVGGAMLWLRFDALDLPADRAVALLPKTMLVVVGAHALVVPVLLGLLAVLALGLIDPSIKEDDIRSMDRSVLMLLIPSFAIGIALIVALTVGVEVKSAIVLAAILLLGVFVAYKLGRPGLPATDMRGPLLALLAYLALAATLIAVILLWKTFAVSPDVDLLPNVLLALLAGAVAFYLLLEVARKTDRLAYFTLTVFAVFAVLGGLSALAKTSWKPRMEPLAAMLEGDDRGLAGFFVGETSDRLYFVELPGNGDPGDPLADAALDRVVSVDRSKVVRLAMREPVGVGGDEAGREFAGSLLQDLRQSANPTSDDPVAITTANPEVAFAPLVHLHPDEDILPMSAQEFIDHSVLGWANAGAGCDPKELAGGKELNEAKGLDPIDVARLGKGPQPYPHGPDEGCLPEGESFAADEHTRPYDGKRGDPDKKKGVPAVPKLQALKDGQGFFLDVAKSARKGFTQPHRPAQQEIVEDVPVYVESHGEKLEAADREWMSRLKGEQVAGALRITYWFFYGLSRPPGVPARSDALVHEGDWERISVLLAHLEPDDSLRYVPVSVTYHHHNEQRVLPWYAVRRVFGGSAAAPEPTHPVVYSAEGSHASYWRAGSYPTEYKPDGKRLFAVDDEAIACTSCPQWHTWDLVLNALDQGWYGFGGAWGEVGGSGDVSGPLGPSSYKIGGRGTPTTKVLSKEIPLPSAPTDVQEVVAGE